MRAARRKLGKRQIDIADEVGCTQPTVHAWETGRTHPRVQLLPAVARAYKLRPAQLIPREAA